MRQDNEHIEEKLVPYLEGVLNPKERREIDEAINSDGELAREMSELREVILELRQGFASGMKPPQEELTVEEVVELSANTGSVDSLPGSSQQKASLFCSDLALEEYSLLRALQEEMARTTLDRENVPEMPEAVLREFRALKSSAPAPSRKVLPFDKKKLSPGPLWRRASTLLDRVDPKPLMASAAALMVLSLGVHFYNRSPAPVASESKPAEIGHNFPSEPLASAITPESSATPSSASQESGVAVFTSDDRTLLKEQAQKLMVAKIRYTVTKDRILVADNDVAQARDILWADSEGKAVAIAAAKEESPQKRLAPSASQTYQGAASSSGSDDFQAESRAVPIVDDVALETSSQGGAESVRVYHSSPSRHDAPQPPAPPHRADTGKRAGSSTPASQQQAYPGRASENRAGAPASGSPQNRLGASSPPPPSSVDLSQERLTPSGDAGYQAPKPTVALEGRAAAVPASSPSSAARRQRIKELALRGESESQGASVADRDEPTVEAPVPTQVQTTETIERARVAAAPPSSPVAAPLPSVVLADQVLSKSESEESKAESRLAQMENSRQTVARRHNVELSFESKDGKVSVYVRPKKSLAKVEIDELRKALRKELGLLDSDTLIFR